MKSTIWIAIFVLAAGCGPAASTASTSALAEATPVATAARTPPVARGPYLGQSATKAPALFAPGLVSTPYGELNATFSPDGNELFFSVTDPGDQIATLVMMRQIDGVWSEPQVAPFSGRYSDVDPMFSPDGQRLYFCSTRPLTGAGEAKDADIWYVERGATGWSEPKNIGAPINTPRNDWYPSITQDGTIYYSTWDPERNTDDIFRARPTGDGGYTVENIGAPINTGDAEFDPFIAPDESYLLFASYRRGNMGSSDLYISSRRDGAWTEPRNLGPAINSSGKDYCPVVSSDGRYFFFTGKRPGAKGGEPRNLADVQAQYGAIENGLGNIYWATIDILELPPAAGAEQSGSR